MKSTLYILYIWKKIESFCPIRLSERTIKLIAYAAFFLCCLVLVYHVDSALLNKYESRGWDSYIMADTWSYITFDAKKLMDPWRSSRTPGYPLYLSFLSARKPLQAYYDYNPDNIKDNKGRMRFLNNLARDNTFFASLFRNLTLVNYVFFSLSLTLLLAGLAKYRPCGINGPFAFFISAIIVLLAVKYGFLPPLFRILADPLAAILACLGCGCLLLFVSSAKKSWLLAACLIAAYSFLVKPEYFFFPFICGIVCLWKFIGSLRKKAFADSKKYAGIGVLLVVCTLAWPAWLYVKGGVLTPSQMSAKVLLSYSTFLVQPGDENLYPEGEMKEIVKTYLQNKSGIQKSILERANFKSYPDPGYDELQTYRELLDPIYPILFQNIRENFGKKFPRSLDQYEFAREFSQPILKKHRVEYFRLICLNFLSAFNQIAHLRPAHAYWISDHYRITFLLVALAIIAGAPALRFPITLFASMHILHMLCCAAHIALPRYIETTEYLMLMAFLLSLYSIICRIVMLLRRSRYLHFHLNQAKI